MNGQSLQVVHIFSYLGRNLSRAVHIDDEVNARIAKASVALDRLRGTVIIEWKWDQAKHKAESLQSCGTANFPI